MDLGTSSEKAVFAEELRILKAAKARLRHDGEQPDGAQYEQLVQHYEKLLRTTMKLSRISDIQGNRLKEQEQHLRTASADLYNLEQLRRQLISDISHELRTPITSVQGYIKAFLDGVVQPEPPYLSMLYEKLLTINQLISDLFQLSTLKANQLSLHLKHVSVYRWLRSIPDKYSLEAERRGITFTCSSILEADADVSMPPDRAVLHIDTVRLEQVITNLVDNAFKFTPSGGTVDICARLVRLLPPVAFLSRSPPRPEPDFWLMLTVSDNGRGIPAADLPFIFERFYRGQAGDAEVAGTGLGLAISQSIVEQHHGLIGVDSSHGAGSRFRLFLPVSEDVLQTEQLGGSTESDR